jgi:hypothetical protein
MLTSHYRSSDYWNILITGFILYAIFYGQLGKPYLIGSVLLFDLYFFFSFPMLNTPHKKRHKRVRFAPQVQYHTIPVKRPRQVVHSSPPGGHNGQPLKADEFFPSYMTYFRQPRQEEELKPTPEIDNRQQYDDIISQDNMSLSSFPSMYEEESDTDSN